MGKVLILLVMTILGVGGGAAAGFMLKPPAMDADTAEAPMEMDAGSAKEKSHNAGGEASYVKIGRQIIIPVVEGRQTQALMLFELALDVPAELSDDVHVMEPRLRDAFLHELFRMSHTGAFMTNYTDERVIEELRRNLTRAARMHLHSDEADVLILDVMRQEL